MSLTGSDITSNADLFRAAYPSWPHPEPEEPSMYSPREQAADRRNDSAEARAYRRRTLSDLRAQLISDGWTAESPLTLDPEAELIARLERQS